MCSLIEHIERDQRKRERDRGEAMAKDNFQRELGKALADRMGLNHQSTLEGWTTEQAGKTVAVKMTTFKLFTEAEYAELAEVASKRILEGSEV